MTKLEKSQLPVQGYSNRLHEEWNKTHPLDNHLPRYLYKMTFRELYDKIKFLPYFGRDLKFRMVAHRGNPQYNTLNLEISKTFVPTSILEIIFTNFDCYINCGELLIKQIIIRQHPQWWIDQQKELHK